LIRPAHARNAAFFDNNIIQKATNDDTTLRNCADNMDPVVPGWRLVLNPAHKRKGGQVRERILYGTRKGAPAWQEEIITNQEKRFDEAKAWAKRNGFDRFRVAIIDLRETPDFTKAIRGAK